MGNCGCRDRTDDDSPSVPISQLEDAIAFLEAACDANLIALARESTANSDQKSSSSKKGEKLIWEDLELASAQLTLNAKGFFAIFSDDPEPEDENEEIQTGFYNSNAS